MQYKKALGCLLFLCIALLRIYAQESVAINDYGAYFIDQGRVIKIPKVPDIYYSWEMEIYLGHPRFWGKYIVFGSPLAAGAMLYNTENGAASEWLEDGFAVTGYRDAVVAPLESPANNSNLFFYNMGYEYELDPVTLKTINKVVRSRKIDFDWNIYEQYAREEILGGRLSRFHGKNFFLDITLGPNIISPRARCIEGGKTNRFVFIVYDVFIE